MGEVVNFRPKRLSGFIPDEQDDTHKPAHNRNLAEPIYDDRECCDANPQPDNLA